MVYIVVVNTIYTQPDPYISDASGILDTPVWMLDSWMLDSARATLPMVEIDIVTLQTEM